VIVARNAVERRKQDCLPNPRGDALHQCRIPTGTASAGAGR
jgi:hypothetical protein